MVQHGSCTTMVPSALRSALTTGPGPEGGASKNSISRPHWPKRSGTGEPLSAAIAGATNTAAETRNAIVPAENRRGIRTRLVDISSSRCWSGHYTVGKWELKCARIHAPEERASPLRLSQRMAFVTSSSDCRLDAQHHARRAFCAADSPRFEVLTCAF